MQIAIKSCRHLLAANGRIVRFGGTQIITPLGVCNFFVPRRIMILDHQGAVIKISHLIS
jgi:hypothetical protein